MPNRQPKILILDIEWRPTKALVWQAWKVNIIDDFILEDGGLLCVGLKWLGEKHTHVYSEWNHGHVGMLEETAAAMAEADAIITFNGDRYDLPKLEGEFILHNIDLPPKVASIDLIKTCKKLGYFKNSLKFISKYLGIGAKLEHEGALFFRRAMEGDAKTQAKMEQYCGQDVKLTEKLYRRILPAIRNHPSLHGDGCSVCGSHRAHHRGHRLTRLYLIERLRCVPCGHWYDGKKISIRKKSNVE